MRNNTNAGPKRMYIVLSQTGTMVSRIIKLFTKANYNHASISLRDDLSLMYSFGRLKPRNPIVAGFVTESASFGTFKHFPKTEVKVISFDVSEEMYLDMINFLENMYSQKQNFGYNYLGLYLAAIKVRRRKKDCYYCSEFVRWFLQKFDIEGSEELDGIAYPTEFLSLPNFQEVYCGKLTEFQPKAALVHTN